MKNIITCFVFIALSIAFSKKISAQAYFPEDNGTSLQGITEFDAIVSIKNWLDMEIDMDTFRSNLESAFHLGLRRDGVVVATSAPNYLFCEVRLAQSRALITYTYQILFYEFRSDELNQLLWSSGGIATVGSANFSYQIVARDCVDTFSNEWLKWNPRR